MMRARREGQWTQWKRLGATSAFLCAMFTMVPEAHAEAPASPTPEEHAPSPPRVQGTAALTVGAAGIGLDRRFWDRTVFHLGLRGDLMFGRSKPTDFGIGPYLEVMTHAFDELQFGGGVTTLLPVSPSLPFVLSAGGYGRYGGRFGSSPYTLEPGVAGALFWGTRSYNFHSSYIIAAGLLAQFRYGLGETRETSIVIGVQADLVALSLPFELLISAIRGGSPATAHVR